MTRITKFSVLLGTGLMFATAPALAGFEFTPPVAPAPAPAQSADAPMPIVPAPDVMAEPLPDDMTASPAPSQTSGDEVYIKRQRETRSITPAANEAVNTDALLKATEEGESMAATQERMDELQGGQKKGLVINPYPLDETASHNKGGMGQLSVEQAMMEEGGNLRPVATPGKNSAQGLRARASITSRYDSEARYLDRAPIQKQQAMANAVSMSGLTPIPGGEGVPLAGIEATPLPPPRMPAGAPTQTMAEAAKQVPAAPAAPMKLMPDVPPAAATASQQPVPRAPDAAPPQQAAIAQPQPQSQPVQTSAAVATVPAMPAMPRPATPQSYPTAQAAPPQTAVPSAPSGTYAEAVGFGRDLPLALALSQVVPPAYSYAFGTDVNVGTTVSWQGGKPWNQVLDDMLTQNGMRAIIQGNQVTIQNARG